jgi:hypothetical protein
MNQSGSCSIDFRDASSHLASWLSLLQKVPSAMDTFDEIRLEIERTLAALEEDKNKRRHLLKHLFRLITLADETISSDSKLNAADYLANYRYLESQRRFLTTALAAAKLKDQDVK